MIRCLYPDCDYSTEDADAIVEGGPERLKRLVINHINHDHDEAHVIIACLHDLTELERFTATTRDPQGVTVEIPQVRYQCVRCGDFEVQSV